MSKKEPFKERIERAKRESAERVAKLSPKELEQLKIASRRHANKVRSEITRNYEIDIRRTHIIDLVQELEVKHQEYIDWLESQQNDFEIKEFIIYVCEKKDNYRKYLDTHQLQFISELPRSMNRYLDEFAVAISFTKQSCQYIQELSFLIEKLK